MVLEPFDQIGALSVSDKRPIHIAYKADVDLSRYVRNREILLRVERVRQLENASCLTLLIEHARGGGRTGVRIAATGSCRFLPRGGK